MAAGSIGLGRSEKKTVSAPGTPPVSTKRASIRVEAKKQGERGTRYRVVVANGGADEVDVTGAMTAPLAHALWQLRGGVDISNWVDAEGLLDQLLGAAGPQPAKPEPAPEFVMAGKRTPARR